MKRFQIGLLVVGSLLVPGAARAQLAEPDARILYSLHAEQPGDSFGWAAEAIGDIDHDRAPDFVIGAPTSAAGGASAGRAYVYSGRTGTLLHVVTGAAGDRIGFSMAGPGDLDRDGTPDYVVGGVGGRVLAISGKTHATLFDLQLRGEGFGYDVGGAGDVDRDGTPDLIVGAFTAPVDGVRFFGKVYVHSGRTGALLWSQSGEAAGALLGTGVSGIGDLDLDGIPEQAVGARGATGAAGRAYVLSGATGAYLRTMTPDPTAGTFGDFFVHDAGDVDRDGVRDIYVGDYADAEGGAGTGKGYVYSGRTGARLWVFRGEAAGEGFGVGRGVGDVNRDRHADLLLASYNSSAGAASGGKIYLYSGKTGQVLRTLTGTVAGAQLGFDALGLGDVDRDRRTDFLITGLGVAHVVAGKRRLGDDDDDDDDGDCD
jgi:hypothetical protein